MNIQKKMIAKNSQIKKMITHVSAAISREIPASSESEQTEINPKNREKERRIQR